MPFEDKVAEAEALVNREFLGECPLGHMENAVREGEVTTETTEVVGDVPVAEGGRVPSYSRTRSRFNGRAGGR